MKREISAMILLECHNLSSLSFDLEVAGKISRDPLMNEKNNSWTRTRRELVTTKIAIDRANIVSQPFRDYLDK